VSDIDENGDYTHTTREALNAENALKAVTITLDENGGMEMHAHGWDDSEELAEVLHEAAHMATDHPEGGDQRVDNMPSLEALMKMFGVEADSIYMSALDETDLATDEHTALDTAAPVEEFKLVKMTEE
jgi:hypothetical protein